MVSAAVCGDLFSAFRERRQGIIGARRALIGVVAGLVVLTCGAVLSRGPQSDVRLVDGRLVGETTGYVVGVRLGDQTFRVSATVTGLRWLTVHVDRNTRILVGEKEGVLDNLVPGKPVRVGYQMDGDRRVATVVEFDAAGGGRRRDAAAAAVTDPAPPGDATVIPFAPVQASDTVETATPKDADRRVEPASASASAPRDPTTATTPQQAARNEIPASARRVRTPPASAPRALPARESVLDLSASVDEWIQAAKRRNVEAQVALYAETLREFYGRREVSREHVRAAKLRTFSSGETLVDVGSPEIHPEPSGRVAVVRFTKWFIVDPEGRARPGHGVQELRWERTTLGWRIISEVDTPRTASGQDASTTPSTNAAP